MRLLGIDLGEKRIGLALSDPLDITAQGLGVLVSRGVKADLAELGRLICDHQVERVVMGLPRNMDGSEGPMAEKVRDFGTKLARSSQIEVVYWDERLSTRAAQRIMIEADLSRSKRRDRIDQVAAAIILQNYMDGQKQL
jgi:putative Holliday junction resolvase